MQRRDFFRTAGLGIASMALPGCLNAASKTVGGNKHPNIIYILVDDLGYGDLGCYGQKRIKTPSLDKMANEGMRFTQHYSGSTVCAPSRCCLMTGYHTGHALVRGNKELVPSGQMALPPETVTVPKLMKKAGYKTALIGKWGLGGPDSTGIPNKQGFDYFYGYLCQRHAHNYYPEFLWRNEQKVKLRNKVGYMKTGIAKGVSGVSTNKLDYSHDFMTQEALAFVERNKQNPFFLHITYTIPHANNEAGKEGMEVPDYGIYKDKDWPEPQKGHAAMITRMDGDVGKLFALIKKLGIDDNTLVIFTSDNGPHREGGNNPNFNNSNGPLRGIKRDLYEGGIRVPMIARWPSKVKARSTNNHISAFWDILPTFAELAGAKAPDEIDGISFTPALLGNNDQQEQHEFLYWEFPAARGTKQAVRMGDWKAVSFHQSHTELYNLKDDLGEKNNVAAKYPDIVKKAEQYMKASNTPSTHWPLKKWRKKK